MTLLPARAWILSISITSVIAGDVSGPRAASRPSRQKQIPSSQMKKQKSNFLAVKLARAAVGALS
ncbi:MAG: hypothetical protein ACI957_005133, partial [Verrucomicrobiales bacterium]